MNERREQYMRVNKLVPLIIVIIFCTCAAFVASTDGQHSSTPPVTPAGAHHYPYTVEHHDDVSMHDAIAVHDIIAHAALHYPDAAIDATTLINDFDWASEW